jgi:hypothetical protein
MLGLMNSVAEQDQVQTPWWQENQDEVMNMRRCRIAAHNRSLHAGFGWFTPQNQHRAGTTWWSSQEELGVEAIPSLRGLWRSPQNCWVPWLLHKAKIVDLAAGDVIQTCREASMWGTRRGITRLVSRGRRPRQRHGLLMRICKSWPY